MLNNNIKNLKENSSFLIVGTVRNCEKNLDITVNKLMTVFGKVKNLHWYLVESDSNDNTIAILDKLRESIKNFDYISLDKLRNKISKRSERLAYCRNTYIKYLNNNSNYINVDYIVVADFDGINDKLSVSSINSCWDNNIWDVCTANQDGPYYDVWALRHPLWSPNDCWAQYNFLNKLNLSKRKNLYASVYSRMIKLSKDSPWIEVDSAFGGIAIYKKEIFKNGIYKGLDNIGNEICEHVNFHKALKEKGAKIYINPKFINAKYTNHTKKIIFVNNLFINFTSLLNISFIKKLIRFLKK